jgi:hypothetical protein
MLYIVRLKVEVLKVNLRHSRCCNWDSKNLEKNIKQDHKAKQKTGKDVNLTILCFHE